MNQIAVGIGLVALAFGLTVLTMAYAIGHVSGCHLNPAVTVGLAAGGRFPASQIAPYVISQVVGGLLGAAVAALPLPRWLVVPDPSLSIGEGAILPWTQSGKGLYTYFERLLTGLANDMGFSLETPWGELDDDVQKVILHGTDGNVMVQWRNRYGRQLRYASGYEGVMPYIQRKHAEADSDWVRSKHGEFLREVPCPECGGARLKPEVLAVRGDVVVRSVVTCRSAAPSTPR